MKLNSSRRKRVQTIVSRRQLLMPVSPLVEAAIKSRGITSPIYARAKRKKIKINNLGQVMAELNYSRRQAFDVFVSTFKAEGLDTKMAKRNANFCIKDQFDPRKKTK